MTASVVPSRSGKSAFAKMHAHVLKLSGVDSSGRLKRSTKDVGEIFHRCKRGTEVNSGVNWHFPTGTSAWVGFPVKEDGTSAVATMMEKYWAMRNRTELCFRMCVRVDLMKEQSPDTLEAEGFWRKTWVSLLTAVCQIWVHAVLVPGTCTAFNRHMHICFRVRELIHACCSVDFQKQDTRPQFIRVLIQHQVMYSVLTPPLLHVCMCGGRKYAYKATS